MGLQAAPGVTMAAATRLAVSHLRAGESRAAIEQVPACMRTGATRRGGVLGRLPGGWRGTGGSARLAELCGVALHLRGCVAEHCIGDLAGRDTGWLQSESAKL